MSVLFEKRRLGTAVGIDAAGHGERRASDFEERFAGTEEENERAFLSCPAPGRRWNLDRGSLDVQAPLLKRSP